MYTNEQIALCRYRLEKAAEFLADAEKTLELEMYDTAANRSYYAIFHAVRALFALDGKDFKKHSGVIAYFQMDYIKTGIFDKRMSDIIKSAFSLRTDSDYEDFFIISHEEVRRQVAEAAEFYENISEYLKTKI
ncbi:MAG: HEPN domain-containing protein [Clostridia bacterium]|nr:HEPN domain-containing protein [Clostridia bacterium]MBR3954011.1 HEPN domain-containing protein [Clostridia bacterium]